MEAFLSSTFGVFIAEIGDKTQIATVLLAARYDAWPAVVAGSVIGLMAANVPVAYCGELVAKIPARAVRITACAVFCALGVLTLLGAGLTL